MSRLFPPASRMSQILSSAREDLEAAAMLELELQAKAKAKAEAAASVLAEAPVAPVEEAPAVEEAPIEVLVAEAPVEETVVEAPVVEAEAPVVEAPAVEEVSSVPDVKMKKAQLLAMAQELGLQLDSGLSKTDIVDAINSKKSST